MGDTREACSSEGACWVFIKVWFRQLMYGRYPVEELWRVNTAYVILAAMAVPLFVRRFAWKHWLGAFLLVCYPLIALYLFAGLSSDAVAAWPYRLMGLSALALGIFAVLPRLGVLRERSAIVSIMLLVLVPLWGLSAPSTWSAGFLYGAPGWTAVAAPLLALVPAVALVVGLTRSRWRLFVAENFRPPCVLVAVLALVGFALPLLLWEEAAGSSPPGVMAVTAAMLALAAVCPWGYDKRAGLPGRLARLLLPTYLVIAYLVFAGPPDVFNFGGLDWRANAKPIFAGLESVLSVVETPLWGGLFLILVIGGVGIVMSLPLGAIHGKTTPRHRQPRRRHPVKLGSRVNSEGLRKGVGCRRQGTCGRSVASQQRRRFHRRIGEDTVGTGTLEG